MLELDGEVKKLGDLPDKGLKEGSYMFIRNGIYYFTYPYVADKTEQLENAIGDNPLCPFKFTGVIMDESPNYWTNHQSIIEFKNQFYLFYHSNGLSPNFDKARSIRADSLFFNEDGTIRKAISTLRGVGLTNASKKIQIDRYSDKSKEGASVNFMDTTNTFLGWKTIFSKPNAWVKYNSVDFGTKPLKSVLVKALSKTEGILELRVNSINGPVVAEVKIHKSNNWENIKADLTKVETGVHNLFVILKYNSNVEIDWISFE